MERKENGGRELNAVSLEERMSALEFAGDWLTDYLDGKTDYGAFSEGAIGCPAVEFFTMRAYEKLMSGRWKWKEGKKMSTKTFRFCELLFNLVCMQKRQSILQRYGKPKCNYEHSGALIGLDVGIKTGVRGMGRYRASDLD